MMSNWVSINKDESHVSKQREKARELRKTKWWKDQIAKGKCYYCGKTFPPVELTLDHIVPLSRGGKSNKGNCVPSCKKCNQEKKYYTPAEIILNQMKKIND